MAPLLLKDKLGESWATMLQDEIKKEYFRKIPATLQKERTLYNIYPESEDVFNAYKYTPFDHVKVIIIGQDPYHGKNQAHGLAFSVKEESGLCPPSLSNIFQEIEEDLGFMNLLWTTDLTGWATQGVFLLNTILTVREGQPLSHEHIGWKEFTGKTIEILNISPQPLVFMLWGANAKSYKQFIDEDHHYILEAPHPSPLSSYRGFDGCKHFSKCNDFLKQNKLKPINWKITL